MARDIREWLDGVGLAQYADAFADNEIDLDALPHITEEDLKEIGVGLGSRRKLLAAIAELSKGQVAPTADPCAGERPGGTEAERRLLTLMFVDIVGSVELSRQLDPEELRDKLRNYQSAVAGEVERYEGHVAKFMGDGVLAYFGWPQAYEDQAERSIHAALGVLEAVGRLNFSDGIDLAVRVGIASGNVVVGDLLGAGASEEIAVTGVTPNLASRLQETAGPNQIIISDMTMRLVGSAFQVLELGRRQLKGFDERQPVWRVLGVAAAESRFQAVHGTSLVPLIGRKNEIGLLRDRWELARSGTGQAALISGEAGIGKSRLVQALRDSLADEPHFRIRYQASPYHTASAFYPIAQRLKQAAGFTPEDSQTAKRRKLERLLALSQDDVLPHLQVIAPLLSIPLGGDDIVQAMAPDLLRERTIEALLEHLLGLSQRRPVLFVFEDAQWTDPSTEELIVRAIPRITTEAVLMVITHRPEWQPAWSTQEDNVVPLVLTRLGPDQVAEMVRSVAGETLDADLVRRIADRTDGVPLFIEELTRLMLETGRQAVEISQDIPETLQGFLQSRLDRLDPDSRDLAQIGSVIGREFTRELLRKVWPGPAPLDPTMERLIASRLIFQTGKEQSRIYVFRHALIQEAAYGSLLLRRRSKYHWMIADALESESKGGAEIPPELIAQHYTLAGAVEAAVPCWLRAGEWALEHSANIEAVEHLKRGIVLSKKLANRQHRLELQLALHLMQGRAQINAGHVHQAIDSYNWAARLARLVGSPIEFARAAIGFEEAEGYGGQVERDSILLLQEAMAKLTENESVERCRVLGGLGRAYLTIGEYGRAREATDAAVEMARRVGDKRALFDALFRDYYSTSLEGTGKAKPIIEELLQLANDIGDWDLIIRTYGYKVFNHIRLGERDNYDVALGQFRAAAIKHRMPIHIWVSTAAGAMDAVLNGDFQQAEERAEEALRLGQQMRMENAPGVYGTQMFTIRREQGRLDEVAPFIRKFVNEDSDAATWQPGLALIASDLGFRETAQKIFGKLADGGFALAYDAKRSATLSYLAEVCAYLEDRPHAAKLYELLLPYSELTITMGLATVCYGAGARYLGLLASTLQEWDAAGAHFETAIETNTQIRAWPWLAHSQADYAAMLQRCPDREDGERVEALLESARSTASRHSMKTLMSRIAGLREQ